jgi:hypothetical protein
MTQSSTPGEIDWTRVHTARIAACCTRAAQDYNLAVESPFTLTRDNDPAITFIALFPSIGGGHGMLVCLSSEWNTLEPLAAEQGYSCAGLDPKHYSSYDREQWKGILEAWGAGA